MKNKYDNSQISTYQACPFSYYLQYVKGLKKIELDDSNSAMNFGDYFHRFAQSFYLKDGKEIADVIKDYREPADIPLYSRENLDFFCRTYKDKYLSNDKDFDIQEVETTSEFDVGGYKFLVKKDGAFKHRENIYGLEHKTTKSISFNYFDKFFLNSQISAQCYDVKRKYGQCSGILLNACEVKLLKRKPTGKYDGVKEIEGGYLAVKYQRDFINRQQSELNDWYLNTLTWIEQIEASKEFGVWGKSQGLWGGMICTKCQYKELCKTSCGMRLDESILECLYEEVDPYEYLKEKVAEDENS